MPELTPSHEAAVDQLTLQLLKDAYFDLAAILQSAQPLAAAAILAVMEQRVVDVLTRICRQRTEGDASDLIAMAVG